jgi:hypothetical protein
MSTVAWKGELLAADQQFSAGGIKTRVQKLFQHEDYAYAITGVVADGLMLAEWYKAGAMPHDFPQPTDKDSVSRLIVLRPSGLEVYQGCPYKQPAPLDGYDAWGSGCEAALGALFMGADAVQAVQAAVYHSEGSGYGVNVIKIPQLQQ